MVEQANKEKDTKKEEVQEERIPMQWKDVLEKSDWRDQNPHAQKTNAIK